jgi:hypothetical protein
MCLQIYGHHKTETWDGFLILLLYETNLWVCDASLWLWLIDSNEIGSFEHGNEHSVSLKRGNYLERFSDQEVIQIIISITEEGRKLKEAVSETLM